MKDSIQLSPKHGVNPSIPICFWCGKEKNEVALLGRLNNDAPAPRHVLLDYDPCDACQAMMDKGITLYEVTPHPNPSLPDAPPFSEKHKCWPTGHFMVVTPEAVSKIFTPDAQAEVLNAGGAFLHTSIFQSIKLACEEADDHE